DGLFNSLGALQTSPEIQVDINGYSTRISVDELASVSDRLHDAILQESRDVPGHALLLDPLACLVPGFSARFSQARAIDRDDLPGALARHSDIILQPSDDLHLLKGLPSGPAPRRETPAEPPAAPPRRAARPPTHVLRDAHARALGQYDTPLTDTCDIRRAGDGCWVITGDAAASVNGAAYGDEPLETGDKIHIGGTSWLMIEVED
ncbi:MAG: hypothetical protein RIC38_02845, partial [Chromatocurvus sp.]